ncbi:unnamed protein product [Penicillium nalgiovense]|nr:unnamed protein product [Penicillium nalgiovense]
MPENTCARSCQNLAYIHSNLAQLPQRDTKKTADSIDVHKINAIPPLVALPPELLLKILGNLQDLEDLFSSILVCRRIFNVLQAQRPQRQIIESTFAKYLHPKTDWGTYKVLIQLSQIIRRDIVHRDTTSRGTTYSIGRALAWSYVLDYHRNDAICLLQLIQKGEPPFGWSTITSSQRPIQPISELLDQLVSEENGVDRMYISSDLDHPLVEINGYSKLSLNDKERAILLRNGILFRENSIVTRKRKPCPPRASSRPMFSSRPIFSSSLAYTFYRRRILNETINGDAVEALAHQRPSSCAWDGQHGSLRGL